MLTSKQKIQFGITDSRRTPSTGRREDTSTSSGLYNIAVNAGFKNEADKVLQSQKGEDVKKIFSGGFVSDIFDGLNALQYGVTGMLKGKSFIEGVKTRQSFSDKDALGDNGLPGVIAGIVADIAVDPLTYIAPWTIAKKVPGLMKAGKAIKAGIFGKMVPKAFKAKAAKKTVQQLTGGTKIGKYIGNKLIWAFGQDPTYKKMMTRSHAAIAQSTRNVVDITKGLAKLPKMSASKLLKRDKTGRFVRKSIKELQKSLGPEDLSKVSKAWKTIDDLGKEAVDVGLLKKEVFENNFGEYIKNAYEEYEKAQNKIFRKFSTKSIKGIKARKDAFGVVYQPARFTRKITKKFTTRKARDTFTKKLVNKDFVKKGGKILEKFKPLSVKELEKLGIIDNPSYLFFKSTLDLLKDVENAKLFGAVNKSFASDIAREGFEQIPRTDRYGKLAGKWLPKYMKDSIQDLTEPVKYGIGKKMMADFKFMKVVMNPGTNARNIISNQILNWWKLGMNPLDPRTQKSNITALKEIFSSTIRKKPGKWIKEAKKYGYNIDTFASNELLHLLDLPEARASMGKIGKNWSAVKSKIGKIYQGEENMAKLSAFIFNKSYKGLSGEAAWKAAESATFNYAQVTPFIRKLRTAMFGFPFITFTTKATPLAVKTALKHPRRISSIGKIKNAIENAADLKETARERAAEPPWIKDGFYIKLPMKDKQGRSAYFDLTYIIPFGDMMSGQFFQRQVGRETGLPESIPSAVMSNSPAINLIKEIGNNEDFYGDKIWKDADSSEKQLGDLFRHLMKTYLPPPVADQLPGGYNKRGKRQYRGFGKIARTPEDQMKQQRNLTQEILRNAGLKIQPINVDIQESYQEWNSRKALETLLREKGVLKEFSTMYVPK